LRRSGSLLAPFAALFFFTFSLSAEPKITVPVRTLDGKEYVPLGALVDAAGADASLDLVTQRGKVTRGTHVAVYQAGMTMLLVDGRLVRCSYPVMRQKGEVLVPAGAAAALLRSFFPGTVCTRAESSLVCAPPAQKTVSPGDAKVETVKQPLNGSHDRIGFIILDPGHGGKDPGAIGKGGVQEKTITLSVTRKLEALLKSNLKGVRVVLTRSNDSFLELGRRTDIANGHLKGGENGVFVSVHVNASVSPRISGFETYFLSQNPSNEEARATSALENDVVVLEDRKHGGAHDDVEHMEAMMITTQIQKESSLLAETVHAQMARVLTGHKSRGVRKADFFVLRGSLMPAILVEIGFITHAKERATLQKAAYQDRVAEALYHGIAAFLKKYNSAIKNK